MHSDSSRYTGENDKYNAKLISEKAIICSEIEKHFKKEYDDDTILFCQRATYN